MLPRHDLFFYIYEAIYRGDHDKFIVEFELPKDATDDLVWALLHKRLSASIISSKALDQKALRTDLVCFSFLSALAPLF